MNERSGEPSVEGGLGEREERFNMAVRKFLKQVGITSQREIERVAREGSVEGDAIAVRVHLTGDGGLDHVIEGRIELP